MIAASAVLLTTISSNSSTLISLEIAAATGAIGSPASLSRRDPQPRMHVEHELVEMDAALGRPVEAIAQQVHEHGFAAPDPAPQIDAAHRLGRLAQHSPDDGAALGHRFQLFLQPCEPDGGGALVRIGLELAAGDERIITGENGGHAAVPGLQLALSLWLRNRPA